VVAIDDKGNWKRRQIAALELAEGFFASQVLFSANELGVFAVLAESPRSVDELADATGTVPDALERLLNACVTVGLLSGGDGVYTNSQLADDVLVPDRPGYMGNWMRLMARWMRAWVRLTDTVRTGEPAEDPMLHLGGDPDYTRDFILGMRDYAQLRGSEIVRYLDLSGGLRLIDVGAGPGTYGILFARKWPDLQVTLFDLPDVVRIAEAQVVEAGLEPRIQTTPGNYYEDEFGQEYDVVFLSDTLHQESSAVCEMILQKAYKALRPGGRIIVQAMFLDEGRVSPRWPVMHSLILLLVYGGGRAYTARETVELLEKVGFARCDHQMMSLLNVNSLIVAEKP